MVLFYIALLYSGLILGLYFGWRKLKPAQLIENDLPKVSVIVPFKDELENINQLIDSLKKLSYPSNKLEIIFCDDHSLDGGAEKLQEQFASLKAEVRMTKNADHEIGKKAALRNGAHAARGEFLLFTDADCKFHPNWIESMLSEFKDQRIQMVQGPVLILNNNKNISLIQQVEFMSLMMTAAGSAALRRALVASAANIAVRKSTYIDSMDHLKPNIHTGDDMFLLEYVKKRFTKGVTFRKDHKAMVSTPAVDEFRQLWNQRKRWSSKAPHYRDWDIIWAAGIVFLANITIISLFILGFIHPEYFAWSFIAILTKAAVDFPMMIEGFKFYEIRKGTKWFLLTQLIYPIYVVAVALAGIFGQFIWKNRNHQGL